MKRTFIHNDGLTLHYSDESLMDIETDLVGFYFDGNNFPQTIQRRSIYGIALVSHFDKMKRQDKYKVHLREQGFTSSEIDSVLMVFDDKI